jgi:hypothetical protein
VTPPAWPRRAATPASVGIATECGMARGDPTRLPSLLAAHARAAELAT